MQLSVFPVVFTAGGSGWTLVPPKAHSNLKDMSLQYVEGSKRLDFLYIYFGSIKWPLCTRERLRATSHTWLKARDHCSPRARIGRKGRDPPSLLHTQDWRPLSIAIWELSLVERAETLQVCFTHITEGPWPLQYKSSHWLKGQRPSKFASHTRLKAHVYCNLRALIGRKGGDPPSSLHTRRWRPKGPEKTSWMRSLHGVLHGGLWIRFHGLLEFLWGPPPRGRSDPNYGRPWLFFRTDCRVDFRTNSRENSKIDKHHQVVLLNG